MSAGFPPYFYWSPISEDTGEETKDCHTESLLFRFGRWPTQAKEQLMNRFGVSRGFTPCSAFVALVFVGSLFITDTYYTSAHAYGLWYIRLVVVSRFIIAVTVTTSYAGFILGVIEAVRSIWRCPNKMGQIRRYLEISIITFSTFLTICALWLFSVERTPFVGMVVLLRPLVQVLVIATGLMVSEVWIWRTARRRVSNYSELVLRRRRPSEID